MKKKPTSLPDLFATTPFAFADRFLQDHAGQIISEPCTAILELIANSYDAGATKIDILWLAVLRKAHQRTFNLQKKLLETKPAGGTDPEVDDVLRVDRQKLLVDVVPKPHLPPLNGTSLPAAPMFETGDGA